MYNCLSYIVLQASWHIAEDLAHCRGQLKAKEVHTKIQDYTATNLTLYFIILIPQFQSKN